MGLAKKPNRRIMKFEELQKTQPAGRGQTVMVRDSVSGKPIIYGGLGQGFKEFKDVWSFDFEKLEWSKMSEFDKPTWFHSGFRISLLSMSVKYPILIWAKFLAILLQYRKISIDQLGNRRRKKYL